jgi:hypothetical protein
MTVARVAASCVQIITASISLISSSTIATAIVCSSGGLNTTLRRLLFGLSLVDVLQSASMIAGPFAVEASDISPLGSGNELTCTLQGFVFATGGYATPVYTWALSYYYYCKIVLNMSDDTFRTKKEWIVHLLAILFGLALCIPAAIEKSFDTYVFGSFCVYGSATKEGGTIFIYYIIFCAFFGLCSIGIVRNSALLLWHVRNREKVFGLIPTSPSRAIAVDEDQAGEEVNDIESRSSNYEEEDEDVDSRTLEKIESARKIIRRTMVIQSCLYVAVFFTIYIAMFLQVVMSFFDGPFEYLLFPTSSTPIGGLLNMLVFLRPSIWILRERHPCSWLKAFIMVIKAGGEVPTEYANSQQSRLRPSRRRDADPPPLSLDGSEVNCSPEEIKMILSLVALETPPPGDDGIMLALQSNTEILGNSDQFVTTPGGRQFYTGQIELFSSP